jgi:Glycosyl hydrolases family 16
MMKRLLLGLCLVACSGETNERVDTTIEALDTTLLGNSSLEAIPDSASSGVAEAFRYVASGTGAVTKVRLYVDQSSAATNASVGIYDDVGGQPSRILSSALFAPSAGWNEVTIPLLSLTAGKTYWIAMLGQAGGQRLQLRARDTSSAVFGSVTTAQSGLVGLPGSWVVGESWPGWTVSAYALAVSGGGSGGSAGGSSGGAGASTGGAGASSGGAGASSGGAGASSGGAGASSGGAGASSGGAGASTGGAGASTGGGAGAPSGQIIFSDDFSTTTWPGPWFVMNRPGDAGNGEVGCYTANNLTRANGLLNITTKRDTSCAGYSYTSGMVQWKTFAFTYGTIEVRAKLAGGQGPWPAIWLLGADCQVSNQTTANNVGACNWPNSGSDEIDIAEPLGSNRTRVNQQIHTAAGAPGCSPSTTDVSQNFHTFGLIWRAGSATWTIDGATTCVVTQNVPSRPMFLIINTAVGGIGGGTVNPATLPQSSVIDGVTVRQ